MSWLVVVMDVVMDVVVGGGDGCRDGCRGSWWWWMSFCRSCFSVCFTLL